ncbi:hypothetical protein GQ42DRAFT_93199 [Ramicandelaber brevisporus]|nr:hypothetical protein GQ42DRAFT_93199 [Ramicandelaber brevisporus]
MIPAPAERRMLQIQRRTQLAGNAHVGIYWNETGKPIELPKGPNAAQFVGIIITPVGQSHPRLEQQMPSTAVSQMETAREYRQMLLDNCIRRIPTATAAAAVATSAGSPSDGDKWIFQPVPPHLLFYVHVVFSQDFPHIGPCLEPRLVSLFDLAPFVRTVAVQANMFALRFAHVIVNQRFVDGIKRTTSSAARESTRYDFPWRKRLQSIHALRKQAGIDGFGTIGTGPSATTTASSAAAAAAGGKPDSDNKDAKAQPLQSQMEAVINTARLGHPAKTT